MLDGMVAIEGGRQTKSGEIFNDLPDRIADALIFVCAGYAVRMRPFGVELDTLPPRSPSLQLTSACWAAHRD